MRKLGGIMARQHLLGKMRITAAPSYPSGEKIYHWPSIGRDIVSTTAVFMDGTIIPEDFMVRVMGDLYSMRYNMLNITAKSLEHFRARANVG